jgi:hypothetical protein
MVPDRGGYAGHPVCANSLTISEIMTSTEPAIWLLPLFRLGQGFALGGT